MNVIILIINRKLNLGILAEFWFVLFVPSLKHLDETALTTLAKRVRIATGKSRAQVARELGVSRPAIFYAEEEPAKSFASLRKRIVEKYSKHKIEGPIYLLK